MSELVISCKKKQRQQRILHFSLFVGYAFGLRNFRGKHQKHGITTMRFHEYIHEQRKNLHTSVKQFLKENKLKISETNMYCYERGELLPKCDDLTYLIRALNLNPKFVLTLWLHEQLPDETYKRYFPLPEISTTNQKYYKVISQNIDDTTTLSKGHVPYLIKNRLARQLLSYFYINPTDELSHTEISQLFAKHKKEDILVELNKLIDFGYIGMNSHRKFHALSKYFYVPSTPHYIAYRKQVMIDMIMHSDLSSQKTSYGHYREGSELYYKRTLTPEQLDYFVGLVQSLYNDLIQLPSSAGQEYNVCLLVGAMNEK